ncbi:MAG TPA: RES family NAD+ phosphorylase [Rubrivivax sp.]|nr:RES family NAD+ phosphorylase [Rubrivivax sp.]HPO18313.1 RES family NAD+ phosphorylase [Rubrivivax sp.]
MRALPLTTATLPPATALYRVQRPIPASGPTGHAVGAVHLPAIPARRGRFDLAGVHVAAFALDPETAVYETIARAAARAVSLSLLGARELLQVQTTMPLNLLDARPHAHGWPFVTATRYAATQDEADDADVLHALFGVVYACAQRQGAECVALFDKPVSATATVLATLSGASAAALHHPSGSLHAAVLAALIGSQLPLLP